MGHNIDGPKLVCGPRVDSRSASATGKINRTFCISRGLGFIGDKNILPCSIPYDPKLWNTPCRNLVYLTANFMPETSQVVETIGEGSGGVNHTPESRYSPMVETSEEVFCAETFRPYLGRMENTRWGKLRKRCVYLIKMHTGPRSREITGLFGNLSHSAVAGIDRSILSRLATDDDLRGMIERMQAEYSLFKV